jgi:hypothetical protein
MFEEFGGSQILIASEFSSRIHQRPNSHRRTETQDGLEYKEFERHVGIDAGAAAGEVAQRRGEFEEDPSSHAKHEFFSKKSN